MIFKFLIFAEETMTVIAPKCGRKEKVESKTYGKETGGGGGERKKWNGRKRKSLPFDILNHFGVRVCVCLCAISFKVKKKRSFSWISTNKSLLL